MTLNQLLNSLGITRAARYSLEETAAILGISARQVKTQIQKGHLTALKSSPRRWAWVLHCDLEAYFAAANVKGGA